MKRQPSIRFDVTPAGPVSDLDNIYLESLLWLTPTNPFVNSDLSPRTALTFSFGDAGAYVIYDPEPGSVDHLTATNWNSTVGPSASPVTLPNGDKIALGSLTGEQAATFIALQAWIGFTNITLTQTTDFAHADFKFLVTDSAGMNAYWSGEKGVLAFSELPNNYGPNYGNFDPNYSPGYAVFNQDGYGWTTAGLAPGGYGYVTILHEIGHLFGLDHPWDEGGVYTENGITKPEPYFPGATGPNQVGANGLNQGIFTTMTYNDGWNGQPSKSADWGYQIGPGAFDIAAMQTLYGTNTQYHAKDDVYVLPSANVSGTGWFCLFDAREMTRSRRRTPPVPPLSTCAPQRWWRATPARAAMCPGSRASQAALPSPTA